MDVIGAAGIDMDQYNYNDPNHHQGYGYHNNMDTHPGNHDVSNGNKQNSREQRNDPSLGKNARHKSKASLGTRQNDDAFHGISGSIQQDSDYGIHSAGINHRAGINHSAGINPSAGMEIGTNRPKSRGRSHSQSSRSDASSYSGISIHSNRSVSDGKQSHSHGNGEINNEEISFSRIAEQRLKQVQEMHVAKSGLERKDFPQDNHGDRNSRSSRASTRQSSVASSHSSGKSSLKHERGSERSYSSLGNNVEDNYSSPGIYSQDKEYHSSGKKDRPSSRPPEVRSKSSLGYRSDDNHLSDIPWDKRSYSLGREKMYGRTPSTAPLNSTELDQRVIFYYLYC